MVMIWFQCWNCKQSLDAPSPGGILDCPRCGRSVRVPDASGEPSAPPHQPRPGRRGPSAAEGWLGGAGALLVVVSSFLTLAASDAQLAFNATADVQRVNSYQIDGFGPLLLALTATAFVLAISRRSPAVVAALGVGLTVFVLVFLARTADPDGQFQTAVSHATAGLVPDGQPRADDLAAPRSLEIVWPTWALLLVGTVLLAASGWAGLGRRRGGPTS
jgi:hypothetical protein